MDVWMDEWTNGRMDEWMDGRVDGRTMGRTTGRPEQSADGLTDHLIRMVF